MRIVKRKILKEKPKEGVELGFGKYFTDHLFQMKYTAEKGWHGAEIVPNEPFALDPATSVLHYAQGVFEGMKAFRQPDGGVAVFRSDENWARMLRSADRLCIPAFPVPLAEEGLKELLFLERDWIPRGEGKSLYIRPVIVGTRSSLGVHSSDEFLFYILLSPVGNYFAHGMSPTKLLVEDVYARAVAGGTGEAKCLGNYAASMKAGALAEAQGFDQVLWLDGAEHKYVQEAGSMNVFFVIGGEAVTPALDGCILPGVTRKTCLQLLRRRGYPVSERRISVDEVIGAARSGALTEAFGTGTAAVISPIGLLRYKGEDYRVGDGKTGVLTKQLYDEVTGIQSGRLPDPEGWRKKVF